MSCTTILVGKNASYDGSTIVARDDDSGAGEFTPKKFIVVKPEEQPRQYVSVISKVKIDLPDDPMRYSALPDAVPKVGIWGQAGFNTANVAMTATETLTSNALVQGADPLVESGIGEEDMHTIVLPYIHSAREGVERLGALLEAYGTYEMNGLAFQDQDEIWWLETIGGHHWIAKRVPDDAYVVVPNQLGIDSFDLKDAFGEKKGHLCSADLLELIEENYLDHSYHDQPLSEVTDFDIRGAFGSRSDADHTYNTPRAWFIERFLNPRTYVWDGPDADYHPESDDIPWSMVPERKLTIEDIKYVLSSHYQGTAYDPYGRHQDSPLCGKYRPIGINRNSVLALTQIRPYKPWEIQCVLWIALGSNAFNAIVPFYGNVNITPDYMANTGKKVSTDNFYWSNRLIAALADAHYGKCAFHIERYQNKILGGGHAMLNRFDRVYMQMNDTDGKDAETIHSKENHPGMDQEAVCAFLEKCNQEISDFVEKETAELLDKVLYEASFEMKNAFARSDA